MKNSKVIFCNLIMLVLILISCTKKEKPYLSSNTDESTKNKPNVILFVADDHGIDALGCYGNPVIQTPNLDKLAKEGVRFTNAYCTSASCAASRSVILTGQYGHGTGSYGHVHDYHHFSTYENVASLPVLLSKEGYETARIGKYHVAPESVYKFNHVLEANPRNTVEMANKCSDILTSEKPFFLYFCTDDPHRGAPFTPEKWNDPNNFGNKKEGYKGVKTITYDPNEVLVPSFLPDTKESRAEIAEYYQSISRIDQGFGKLMLMLKEAGKINNTIVVYISDNGMAFPGAKTTLYEPGIKLPCIIKDPRLKNKGIVNTAKISWADLTPTLLDMTNTTYDSSKFHGKSFGTVLDQENPEYKNEVYASHTFHEITMYYPMRAYIKDNYKLIVNFAWQLEYPFASDLWAASTWQEVYRNKKEFFGNRKVVDYIHHKQFELFDLSKDPDELVNLAYDKENKKLLDSMIKKIKDFQRKTKDPWLISWNHDSSLQGTGVDL